MHQSMAQNLSDIWGSTLEIGSEQRHSITEIAPLKPFLCVYRRTVRYDFRGGANAIQYIVNKALTF